jgi:hypothetical protein
MEWYYSEHGQQIGPVSEAQFEELVHSGRINESTLVWTPGMADWKPHGEVGGGGESEHCISCNKLFPKSELIRYESSWVCAGCKPVFFQRVKEGLAGSDRMVWREGRAVVMSRNGILPDRCIKCNDSANGRRLVRKLRWHSPVVYLCVLLNLLVYVIVALIVSQKARVEVGMCDKHRASRLWAIAIGWGLFFAGVGLLFAAAQFDHSAPGFAGAGLILAGFIYGMWKGRSVYATRIDKERVWMKGFCKAYLDELPDWTSVK